jgi:hypothetical protein
MKFINGYPVDTTATDAQDSVRLAGLMAMIGQYLPISLLHYVKFRPKDLEVVRCPDEYIYDLSRDQLVCFAAGIQQQRVIEANGIPFALFRKYKWRVSKDIVSPSVQNHFRIAFTGKSNWLGEKWLSLDLWYNSKLGPDTEQNQLIAMCATAGRLKEYVRMTPWWKDSLRKYWGDRQEQDFCEQLIQFVEANSI